MSTRTVLHIDVNSAYLSWEAVHRLEQGDPVDLRDIPSIVGGNPKTRRGIVLAKSIPAKRFGIQTGETLHNAFKKCPQLTVASPTYGLYMNCSNAMKALLERYVPKVQRFSVDEFFIDLTDCQALYGDPTEFGHFLKDTVYQELGFTCNVGISSNKLLAKTASDFSKPDRVHTLYPEEIATKLWPLPVSELYLVGRRTLPKLEQLGIFTIGDLATTAPSILQAKLKKQGLILYDYAHGIESSLVQNDTILGPKGIGNSTTIHYDVTDPLDAHCVLLALTESVTMRLRKEQLTASLVSVSIKYSDLSHGSHQRQLGFHADQTMAIYKVVEQLFHESWIGDPIRHLGVRISGLKSKDFYQYSLLDPLNGEKMRVLDHTIDLLRNRFGQGALVRACFVHSGIKAIQGGTTDDASYPVMKSIL